MPFLRFSEFMDTESAITLSQAAVAEIQRLRSQHSLEDTSILRLEVVQGGCMGWYYDLSFLSESNCHGCQIVTCEGIQVTFPESSQSLLVGLRIDYSEDLMGGGFRFTNPNAVQTCGCGSSFSTKMIVGDSDTIHSCV